MSIEELMAKYKSGPKKPAQKSSKMAIDDSDDDSKSFFYSIKTLSYFLFV